MAQYVYRLKESVAKEAIIVDGVTMRKSEDVTVDRRLRLGKFRDLILLVSVENTIPETPVEVKKEVPKSTSSKKSTKRIEVEESDA